MEYLARLVGIMMLKKFFRYLPSLLNFLKKKEKRSILHDDIIGKKSKKGKWQDVNNQDYLETCSKLLEMASDVVVVNFQYKEWESFSTNYERLKLDDMEDELGKKVAASNPINHLSRFFVLTQREMKTKGIHYQVIRKIFEAFTDNTNRMIDEVGVIRQYNRVAVLPEMTLDKFKSEMFKGLTNQKMIAKVIILAKIHPKYETPFELILAKAVNNETNRDEVLFLLEKDKHFYEITRNVTNFLSRSHIVYPNDILS